MTTPYEWLIGLRYIRAGRRSGRNSYISFMSLVSIAGVGLGVAALIVVLSVMNGFQRDVGARMISILSHIEVFDARGILTDWQATARDAEPGQTGLILKVPYDKAKGGSKTARMAQDNAHKMAMDKCLGENGYKVAAWDPASQ